MPLASALVRSLSATRSLKTKSHLIYSYNMADALPKERKRRKWDEPAAPSATTPLPSSTASRFSDVGPAYAQADAVSAFQAAAAPSNGIAQFNPAVLAGLNFSANFATQPVRPIALDESALKNAQAAAAAVMARLVAQGAGPRPAGSGSSELVREVIINDAPPAARFQLTKRTLQEDIQRRTNTIIVNKGRFFAQGAPRPEGEKALHLRITAAPMPGQSDAAKLLAIETAEAEIHRVLRGERPGPLPGSAAAAVPAHVLQNKMGAPPPGLYGPPLQQQQQQLTQPQLQPQPQLQQQQQQQQPYYAPPQQQPQVQQMQQHQHLQQQQGIGAGQYQQQQQPLPSPEIPIPLVVYVGVMGPAPVGFNVLEKITGPGSAYFTHICSSTGANILLRGRGSISMEGPDPLHLYITGSTQKAIQDAKGLALDLVNTVRSEFLNAFPHLAGTFQAPTVVPVPQTAPTASVPAQQQQQLPQQPQHMQQQHLFNSQQPLPYQQQHMQQQPPPHLQPQQQLQQQPPPHLQPQQQQPQQQQLQQLPQMHLTGQPPPMYIATAQQQQQQQHFGVPMSNGQSNIPLPFTTQQQPLQNSPMYAASQPVAGQQFHLLQQQQQPQLQLNNMQQPQLGSVQSPIQFQHSSFPTNNGNMMYPMGLQQVAIPMSQMSGAAYASSAAATAAAVAAATAAAVAAAAAPAQAAQQSVYPGYTQAPAVAWTQAPPAVAPAAVATPISYPGYSQVKAAAVAAPPSPPKRKFREFKEGENAQSTHTQAPNVYSQYAAPTSTTTVTTSATAQDSSSGSRLQGQWVSSSVSSIAAPSSFAGSMGPPPARMPAPGAATTAKLNGVSSGAVAAPSGSTVVTGSLQGLLSGYEEDD